ncbi:MAG: hypothetical protein RIR55_760 [Bacteroidota bacterium]|jgi:hypothetical protein
MKPIERIAVYLQFKTISPHAFERNIHLSNGYYSKQLKNLGSVGSDILIKIHHHFPDLNILWVLTGEGQMILEDPLKTNHLQLDEFSFRYESENKKLKNMESDLEKLNTLIKDKEKIIGLYEFMLNNNNHASTISDAR